ncbi:MAG TPA: aminotransferase class III-fold pyridoxal phosphate-dependent enzyme [Abditibacteriaceae bacterium]|jgi:putrescine aminotransferase
MSQTIPAPPEVVEHLEALSANGVAVPDEHIDETPEDAAIIDAFEEHVNPSLASLLKFMGFDSVEVEARDCIVRDSQGREFLDCLGGYGTMSVGHTHPRVVQAVKNQLDKMAMSSRVLFNAPQALLAKKLAEITPGNLNCAFFCNSGAEAAEAAIKIARMKTGRTKLVSASGSYHGKTLGALSVSGREKYKSPFAPLIPNCFNVPFGDIAALETTVDSETAAILLEPIQGEAGIILPPDGYLKAAREIADRNGALLVFDEVQTGLGRTGKLWGCDWDGVAPDLMLLAKALSGGCVPIGAVVGTPETWTIWSENPLIHSTTFGGNPLACAAALETIAVIEEENLVARSLAQGEKLMARLRATQSEFPHCVKEIRGRGLMIGFEFTHEDIGGLAIAGLAQRHVLCAYSLNNPTVMRFEPPLTISDEQIEWAATAFHEAVAQTSELVEGMDLDE